MSGRAVLSASWKSEAQRPGERAAGIRGQASLPGSWSPAEVRAIRNNDSPIQEEEGSPCCHLISAPLLLPCSRAFSLEKTFKATFVLRASRHQLEKVNLANDMKILQGRILAGKLQRTPSADVLKTSESRN